MDYIKETLQRELKHINRELEANDEHINHLSNELELVKERRRELAIAKDQLQYSLGIEKESQWIPIV